MVTDSDCQCRNSPVPEFIDPVFVKTSRKRSVLVIENERFGLVFAKTGSINSATGFNPSILYDTVKSEGIGLRLRLCKKRKE